MRIFCLQSAQAVTFLLAIVHSTATPLNSVFAINWLPTDFAGTSSLEDELIEVQRHDPGHWAPPLYSNDQ